MVYYKCCAKVVFVYWNHITEGDDLRTSGSRIVYLIRNDCICIICWNIYIYIYKVFKNSYFNSKERKKYVANFQFQQNMFCFENKTSCMHMCMFFFYDEYKNPEQNNK